VWTSKQGVARLAGALTLAATAGVACSASAPTSRYAAEHFRTTRTNFIYVRDRITHNWVNRHCELRAPEARRLPYPLETNDSGTLLQIQMLKPGSAQSAGLRSAAFETRDASRVWVIDDVLDEYDVDGRTSYQVQVAWPKPGAETSYDPAEIFYLPALGDQPPNSWGPWVTASKTRAGAFAWWSETTGQPPEPPQPIAHPFEIRCQVVFTDTPGVVR
jgi:hypothetical protein